ncbi:MAG: hypothetical protein ACO3A2_08150, partial [Bdellovibrionia bacterium]
PTRPHFLYQKIHPNCQRAPNQENNQRRSKLHHSLEGLVFLRLNRSRSEEPWFTLVLKIVQ